MPRQTAEQRAAMREKLIDIAEAEITRGGIVALRARDLAREAGIALGSIYSSFGDLGEIAVEVNRRTLTEIIARLETATDGLDEPPDDLLLTLAQTYADYASNNGPRWRTLFAVGLSPSEDQPGFHDAFSPVAAIFSKQLAELFPLHTDRRLESNARMLFAAVHGQVVLGQEARISILASEDLAKSVSAVVTALTSEARAL